MIKRITLENFQSHPDTTIELSPGITALTGPSDNGKTAVLRALNWVRENKPDGTAFLSHWAKDKDCRVTIETDRGIVVRYKGKSGNGYILNGKDLAAVNREVPREVSEFFNLSDASIQKQLDGPFLLSETPGEVARYLNRVVNLTVIDVYLSRVDSKKREKNASLKDTKTRLDTAEKALSSWDWYPEADALLGTLEATDRAREAKKTRLDGIRTIRDRLRDLREKERSIVDTAGLKKRADELEALQKEIEEKERVLTRLKRIGTTLSELRGRSASVDLDAVKEALEKFSRTEERATRIRDRIDRLRRIKTEIERGRKALRASVAELARLESERPEICPLCGGKL